MVPLISASPEPQTFPVFSLLYIHSLVDFTREMGFLGVSTVGKWKFSLPESMWDPGWVWLSLFLWTSQWVSTWALSPPISRKVLRGKHRDSQSSEVKPAVSSLTLSLSPTFLGRSTSSHNSDCSTEGRPKSLLNFFFHQSLYSSLITFF